MRKRLARCRRGASAAEFAIIAPALLVLLGGLADLGVAMRGAIGLETAARAGAQFAMSFPEDAAGIRAAAIAALGSGAAGATVAVSAPLCACPGGSASPVSCTGTPCGGAPSAIYVTVSVTRPFAAPVGIGGLVLPGVLAGEAVARVR